MVQEELKREREREKHLKYIILVAKNKKIWDNSKWEKSLLRIKYTTMIGQELPQCYMVEHWMA